MAKERTYIMLKPDCVKRKLMGEVISRIEKKGYTISNINNQYVVTRKCH